MSTKIFAPPTLPSDGSRITFSETQIKSCEERIETAQHSFFETVGGELEKLRLLLDGLPHAHSPEAAIQQALAIKSHAEMFDYNLIAGVAAQIADSATHPVLPQDRQHRLLLELLRLLEFTIQKHITRDEHGVARQLNDTLHRE